MWYPKATGQCPPGWRMADLHLLPSACVHMLFHFLLRAGGRHLVQWLIRHLGPLHPGSRGPGFKSQLYLLLMYTHTPWEAAGDGSSRWSFAIRGHGGYLGGEVDGSFFLRLSN